MPCPPPAVCKMCLLSERLCLRKDSDVASCTTSQACFWVPSPVTPLHPTLPKPAGRKLLATAVASSTADASHGGTAISNSNAAATGSGVAVSKSAAQAAGPGAVAVSDATAQ